MTVEVVIPLSLVTDWFWSLNVDLRCALGFAILGLVFLCIGIAISGSKFNGFYAGGLISIGLAIYFFLYFISGFIMSSAPPEFILKLQNATQPLFTFKVI